jgi:hypothetical protein
VQATYERADSALHEQLRACPEKLEAVCGDLDSPALPEDVLECTDLLFSDCGNELLKS